MKVLKKTLKTQLALLLALLLTLALGTTAFAAESYSITVKNSNPSISMAGNTYSAYKLFDVTYSDVEKDSGNYAYTVNDNFVNFTYSYSATNDNGEETTKTVSGETLIEYLTTLEKDSEALDTFAEAALKYATEQNIKAAGTVKAETNATQATISVPSAGYYLVAGSATAANNQTVVAACSLTTTNPTAEVNVKAEAPSIEKKIVEADNNKVDANTASIGDTVNYEISSKVPNMKGYEKYFFVINDTLSEGLTYNGDDTMTVKIGEKKLTKYNETTKDGDYTVESSTDATTGKKTITIVFKNFIQYKEKAGTDITVTYSATLNENASLSTTDGNPNTVTLTYSNNPNVQGTGTPENLDKPNQGDATGTTPKSEVKTYVTGIKINKVDGTDNTKKLAGAKFSISGTAKKVVLTNKVMYKASETGDYYMLKDGTYTTEPAVIDKGSDGYNANKYDSTTQQYEKVTVVDKETVATEINTVGYTNKEGILTFEGLNAGTYTITEIAAPAGYNLLKDAITIIITDNADLTAVNWIVKEKVGDGEESKLTAGEDNLFSFKVENNAGSELPSTGGMGTTIFYVLGSLLVVIAGVALVTKKRMSRTEK